MSEGESVGKINVYACQSCDARVVTRIADAGTTPFQIECEAPGCGGSAFSSFYRVRQDLTPSREWYRPSADELGRVTDPVVLQHVELGGLLLRDIVREGDGVASFQGREIRTRQITSGPYKGRLYEVLADGRLGRRLRIRSSVPKEPR